MRADAGSVGGRAVELLTEWPEFAELDWPDLAMLMADPVIVDTRNLLPVDKVTEAGFRLVALGRPAQPCAVRSASRNATNASYSSRWSTGSW